MWHLTSHQRRIEAHIEPVETPVKMGTGNPAGSADSGNDLPLCHLLTDLNQNLMQVQKG